MTDAPENQDRRGFLQCMTWAGAAAVWSIAGGIPSSRIIGSAEAAETTSFTFAQVSDSHLGFDKPVNTNVTGTFQEALTKVTSQKPAFIIHTGDITHLSKPKEFDDGAQLLKATNLQVYTVPGEHDVLEEDRKSYLNRYGKGTKGDGWYSFNAHGVHFIGLVNVIDLHSREAGVERVEQVIAGLTAAIRAAIHDTRGLGGEHHFVAPQTKRLECVTDQTLGLTLGVHVRGIDEVDPCLVGELQLLNDSLLLERTERVPDAPLATEGHRPEAQFRDIKAGAAEQPIAHDGLHDEGQGLSHGDPRHPTERCILGMRRSNPEPGRAHAGTHRSPPTRSRRSTWRSTRP